jgi:hypothetical protein
MKSFICLSLIAVMFCLFSCHKTEVSDIESEVNLPIVDTKSFGDSSFFVGTFMGKKITISNIENSSGKGDCPLKNCATMWYSSLNSPNPPILGVYISAQYSKETIENRGASAIFSEAEKSFVKISGNTLDKEGFFINVFEGKDLRNAKTYSTLSGNQDSSSFVRIIGFTRTLAGNGPAKPIIAFKAKLYDNSGKYVGSMAGITQLMFDAYF